MLAVDFSRRDEQGVGGGKGYATYARSTDGSAAVRLGKGDAHSLSSEGRWALAGDLETHTLTLLPTGAGQPKSIRETLLPVGDDVAFICGHGPTGTIGKERVSNPFLV